MASGHVPLPLYEPLSPGQIRLITIEASEQLSDPIHCQLRAYNGETLPPYKALSYVWGDPFVTAPVTINGIAVDKTVNLSAALRRLRRLEDTHYWIDAICIDQTNDAEKSEQVARMGEIYKNAATVLAWLGESTSTSDDALDFITEWTTAALQLQYTPEPFFYRTPVPSDPVESYVRAQWRHAMVREAVALVRDPWSVSRWSGLSAFLGRPYWNRIWIIQELNLAREVTLLCGESTCDFYSFKWMLDLEDEAERLRMWTYYDLQDIEHLRSYTAAVIARGLATVAVLTRTSLCSLVKRSFLSLATDPRDKIYALLGLVPSHMKAIDIDYTRNVVQVYTDFVLSEIITTGRLSTFYSTPCNKNERTRSIFPSWVPDLQLSGRRSMRNLEPYACTRYDAAARQPAVWTVSADHKQLTVRGVRRFAITTRDVAPKWLHRHPTDMEVAEVVAKWYALSQSLELRDTHVRFDHLQTFFRTILHDESNTGPPDYSPRDESYTARYGIPRFNDMVVSYASWQTLLRQENPNFDAARLPQLDIQSADTQSATSVAAGEAGSWGNSRTRQETSAAAFAASRELVHWLDRLARTSCFFLSDEGYMGTAPLDAGLGDIVCVLLGSDTPMVLRRHGDHFTLVGPCYVCGLMYGQAVKEAREGKREFEVFDLR